MALCKQQIPVFVRMRPLNEREVTSGAKNVWELTDSSLKCTIEGRNTGFHVDKVFNEESRNLDVFARSTEDIVNHAVQGYSGTVFAYGQTSSGKTHTMMGNGTEDGIVQLSMSRMWEAITKDTTADFIIRVTSMEVYQEKITDLKTGAELELVEKGSETMLKGSTSIVVSSAEHAVNVISSAMEMRHVGKTNMNEHSSRSHTIFRIQIDRMPKAAKTGSTRSLLHLVDLAGSESVKKTGTEGQSAREAAHINQSLSALVRVIKSLTMKSTSYVPFRDSKLTRLLKTSLGGNTKTSIICCATFASTQVEQTISTLRFAQEASKVKNDPKRCVLDTGDVPPNLRKAVQAMAAAQTAEAREEYRAELNKLVLAMEEMKQHHESVLRNEQAEKEAAHAELESLEIQIVETAEMAQEYGRSKDEAKEQLEEELYCLQQEKLDADMAIHRFSQEVAELKKELVAVKATNKVLVLASNGDQSRISLVQKVRELEVANDELRQHDVSEDRCGVLQEELADAREESKRLQEHVSQLNQQQVERELAYRAKLEAAKEEHSEELREKDALILRLQQQLSTIGAQQ